MAALPMIPLLLAHDDPDTGRMVAIAGIICACMIGIPAVIAIVMTLYECLRDSLRRRFNNKRVNPPPEEAASLPVQIFSDGTRLAGTKGKCTICSSEFKSGDKLNVLPRCHHGFHVKCLQGLASRASCPVCGTKCQPENPTELDV